ncbi:hypothetical protein NECAME_02097 [Necator americanus]|uniref:Uncharacterized protein n=1 Tax=Necator americanus TaxID=51031 RepID=W2TLC4_NECAM|nr:hypothetical protein NECAME_02097 [Necator americanus]ETN81807.1 hypothetical protein NECAME_02097 [Necator americanus]
MPRFDSDSHRSRERIAANHRTCDDFEELTGHQRMAELFPHSSSTHRSLAPPYSYVFVPLRLAH